MTLYEDTRKPVRREAEQVHQAALDGFSRAGTWWTGAERAEIVAETRRARVAAGLQETDGQLPEPGDHAELGAVVRAAIRQIATAPKEIGREFFEGIVPGELSDAEYVELVSVCARVVDLDVFARGMGLPMRDLTAPSGGAPTEVRPETAIENIAFVATIPNGKRGGAEGAALYGGVMNANILRAASLVPNECRSVSDLNATQYGPMEKVMDLGFVYDPAMIRPQIELMAGRISALNDCFY